MCETLEGRCLLSYTLTELGGFPVSTVFSEANAVNDEGQLVGASSASSGTHAFLWQDGVMTDLGALGGGYPDSVAKAINDQGQVVGYSYLPGNTTFRAFLWQDGVAGFRSSKMPCTMRALTSRPSTFLPCQVCPA